MDPGVGATGTGQLGRLGEPCGPAERLAQRSGDGWNLGLVGEAPEGGAVVGDQEPPTLPSSVGGVLHPQTNSIRAIGALSPGRGPNFKMRV